MLVFSSCLYFQGGNTGLCSMNEAFLPGDGEPETLCTDIQGQVETQHLALKFLFLEHFHWSYQAGGYEGHADLFCM